MVASAIFGLFFATFLYKTEKVQKGINIRYRTDGKLFSLRSLIAKTKVLEELICEALFTNDCALLSHSESDLQLIYDRFSEATKQFGLTISLENN